MTDKRTRTSRRAFLSATGQGIVASSVVAGFPAIVPSSVFGATAPSNRINVGAIGTGRISRGHDMPGIWKHDGARIMAVCDLDSQARGRGQASHQRSVQQADRQALRWRHGIQQLSRAAGQPRHRRRRHQHARSLACDHRHRRRSGRQGRLSSEAGVAHDCGRAGAQRCRPSFGTHLPDWQPAAVVAAGPVPSRVRARAQRAHRRVEDRGSRAARGSVGPGGAGDARAEESQLRHVAGIDAGRPLHRKPRAPAGGIRPPGLAQVRAVRRRHDHGLGRAPRRYRALGNEYRVHGACRGVGIGGVPEQRTCGTCTATSRPKRSTPTASG